jgi:hypothetical protein
MADISCKHFQKSIHSCYNTTVELEFTAAAAAAADSYGN